MMFQLPRRCHICCFLEGSLKKGVAFYTANRAFTPTKVPAPPSFGGSSGQTRRSAQGPGDGVGLWQRLYETLRRELGSERSERLLRRPGKCSARWFLGKSMEQRQVQVYHPDCLLVVVFGAAQFGRYQITDCNFIILNNPNLFQKWAKPRGKRAV